MHLGILMMCTFVREHLQIELFTLNVIMTLRGEGGLGCDVKEVE